MGREVRYGSVDSPLGPLRTAVTDRGLLMLGFGCDADDADDAADEGLWPMPEVREQLGDYFGGRRREFDLPLDWALSRGFARAVLEATARIPFGETRSYAEIAAAAGSPRAFRAAGNALGGNPLAIVVPCHRVVASGGGLGGYGGGLDRKRRLLELEGAARR